MSEDRCADAGVGGNSGSLPFKILSAVRATERDEAKSLAIETLDTFGNIAATAVISLWFTFIKLEEFYNLKGISERKCDK